MRRPATRPARAAERAFLPTPAIVFLIGAAMVLSRRPDAIFNAQFWAEDGAIWYADAYRLGGLAALLETRDGYFQTISRLTAALAQLVPLAAAPLLFNLVALCWQALPAAYLASARFAALIPAPGVRLLLAFILLGLPNSAEVYVNITNTQSHLVLLALLIVLGTPAGNRWVRLADHGIVALAGLSSIMSVFLAPVTALLWWRRRRAREGLLFALTTVTSLVQLGGLATGPDTRSHDPLGASVALFLQIIGAQLVASPLVGTTGYDAWLASGPREVLLLLGMAGLALLAYAALRGPFELRLFLVFAAGIFTVALLFGQARSAGAGVWSVLVLPEASQRYFFFPALACIASALWMAGRAPLRAARFIGVAWLSVLLVVGVPLDWRHAAPPDLRFADQTRRFEQAPAGTRVVIPINPNGWTMTLVKR